MIKKGREKLWWSLGMRFLSYNCNETSFLGSLLWARLCLSYLTLITTWGVALLSPTFFKFNPNCWVICSKSQSWEMGKEGLDLRPYFYHLLFLIFPKTWGVCLNSEWWCHVDRVIFVWVWAHSVVVLLFRSLTLGKALKNISLYSQNKDWLSYSRTLSGTNLTFT